MIQLKNSLRFAIPLLVILSIIAYSSLPIIQFLTSRWFERDAEIRSQFVLAALEQSLSESAFDKLKSGQKKRTETLQRIADSERVFAIALCKDGKIQESTSLFPKDLKCTDIDNSESHTSVPLVTTSGTFNTSVAPLVINKPVLTDSQSEVSETFSATMILIHDMGFVQKRFDEIKQLLFFVYLILAILISIVTVWVSRWSYRGWLKSVRDVVSRVSLIPDTTEPVAAKNTELQPLLSDLRSMMRDLQANRAIRDDLQLAWTPQTLRDVISQELAGSEVIVVSNRQPYIHQRTDGEVKVLFPASGLVTALEPILRACQGIWVAHGNGNADAEYVDSEDCVLVPPSAPEYKLKRVWLTQEEEEGYYYGFSNEGLWPLCHIAHTRPLFRVSDWDQYVRVNQKFADAIVSASKSKSPIVLVQDYHLALVPRMVRNKLPEATIITFWHIPWPNPEAFGICPWREEILDGLMGSSIVGFHIRFHRNNFLESIDRYLESRIDRETSSISYSGNNCLVKSYPISIEWPPRLMQKVPPTEQCREGIRRLHNLAEDTQLGLGIDRMDYSKGILERFRSVDRLFELQPDLIGKFSFVQIAAPSRSTIAAYQQFEREVHELADSINEKYEGKGAPPIILLAKHHEPEAVYKYMRAVDLCFVSSLHDGMNLVSKEFVASRDDERGVLILSMFAGASRELTEALIVNPYDVEHCANALLAAIRMPDNEQQERMHAMRNYVREFNIYRWAGKMLIDAAIVRRRSMFERKFTSVGTNY